MLEQVGNTDILRFQSWGELLDYAEHRNTDMDTPSSRRTEEVRRADNYWSGTETWQEALDLAHKGWTEGTNKVRSISNVLLDKITSLIEPVTLEYDVTGMDFDMGLYLRGVPENWYILRTHIEEGEGCRVVRIVFNCSASCGVSTTVITAKGSAIVALVEALESAGIRVELTLTQQVTGHTGYRAEIYTLLKAADQPLDVDRFSFALAHPATLRRIHFAVEESLPRFVKHCRYSYGHPDSVSNPKKCGDIIIEKSFYGEPQWTDEQSTVRWILDQLKAQGVKVSEEILA